MLRCTQLFTVSIQLVGNKLYGNQVTALIAFEQICWVFSCCLHYWVWQLSFSVVNMDMLACWRFSTWKQYIVLQFTQFPFLSHRLLIFCPSHLIYMQKYILYVLTHTFLLCERAFRCIKQQTNKIYWNQADVIWEEQYQKQLCIWSPVGGVKKKLTGKQARWCYKTRQKSLHHHLCDTIRHNGVHTSCFFVPRVLLHPNSDVGDESITRWNRLFELFQSLRHTIFMCTQAPLTTKFK